MILKIELENFFSIKDRIRIDFRAASINTASSRELAYNVMTWKGTPVLKSIGLFGPNASGKSNILKAISFCCRLILESHLHNEGVTFNFEPFKFDGCPELPSRFLIDFVCEDVEYEYAFELTRKGIISESLYHYPTGRRAKVFVRNADGKYSFGTGVVSKPQDVAKSTGSKTLFLSRASSMNRPFAQRLYRYFMHKFLLGLLSANELIFLKNFNTYKRLILKALEICDSDITDIEMRKEKVPMPVFPAPGQTEMSFKLMDVLRFRTTHRGRSGVKFDMETEESNGTWKLFNILIFLLDVAKNRKSIMIDEFDMGLHTRLADFILDLVHASAASQLLFTSHNTNIIDLKRLRRDQIVFVNKSEDGATNVY